MMLARRMVFFAGGILCHLVLLIGFLCNAGRKADCAICHSFYGSSQMERQNITGAIIALVIRRLKQYHGLAAHRAQ
jgi:hypothetical protein